MNNAEIKTEIIQHALSLPNQEICGYVLKDKYYPAINVATNPSIDFQLDSESTLKVLKSKRSRPIIVHSHVNENKQLSVADVKASRSLNLPYLMLHLPSQEWHYYDPKAILPYEGREWSWTTANCYTLLQDYYKQEFQIKLDDFYLETPTEFSDPNFNSYLLNIESQGFILQHSECELKRGDFLLMKVGNLNPNHAAIVYSPEDNLILHHVVNHYSSTSTYGSRWRKATSHVYRHQTQL